MDATTQLGTSLLISCYCNLRKSAPSTHERLRWLSSTSWSLICTPTPSISTGCQPSRSTSHCHPTRDETTPHRRPRGGGRCPGQSNFFPPRPPPPSSASSIARNDSAPPVTFALFHVILRPL